MSDQKPEPSQIPPMPDAIRALRDDIVVIRDNPALTILALNPARADFLVKAIDMTVLTLIAKQKAKDEAEGGP